MSYDREIWPEGSAGLLLIRHPQVDRRLEGICYGRSDVALSDEGRQQSFRLARRFARLPIGNIFHSGLQRTTFLAAHLGVLTGIPPQRSDALAERDFGSWELQTWDEIYRREGDAMLKMITEPDAFRPGGGETTSELADRVWNWYRERQTSGLTVAVTHGGPIAACLGRHRRLPIAEWAKLIPACGTHVWMDPHPALDGSSL